MEEVKTDLSTKENLPKVFIVVLNHNEKNVLVKKLTELFRSNYGNFEIVLVDNASIDGSLEEMRGSFSRVTLIKNSQNIGRAAGWNVGIKYALERDAQYLLLLRDGVSISKETLPVLVKEMEMDKTIGLTSPIVHVSENKGVSFSGGKIDWLKMKLKNERGVRSKKYYDSAYLDGGAVLIRTEVFRKVGLLGVDYFFSGGETELSFRARRAGYKLLISPDCQAVCSEEGRIENKEVAYQSAVSTLLFFRNNLPVYLLPWGIVFLGTLRIKNWAEVKFSKQASAEILMRQRVLHDVWPKKSLF